MLILVMKIKIALPYCHSLKEKRKVRNSLQEKLYQKFRVSVREIAEQDLWQTLFLGLSFTALSDYEAEQQATKIIDFLDVQTNNYSAEMLDCDWFIIDA